MALFQIIEPGQAVASGRRKRASGIDLGTTNSLVATVHNGKAYTLVGSDGQHILPSVVRYQKNQISVGHEAKNFAVDDATNTVVSVKRLLGKSLLDIDQESLPYQFDMDSEIPTIHTEAGLVNPVQVSAEILKSLYARAEQALGGEPEGVVITVPAYFDDAQRQCTKDAAQLAGMNVLRLLNEPTAAAIAYGLDSQEEGTIAVYDLGGGTFDISILRLSRGVFEVLATGGDSSLGGDDFDMVIAHWIGKQAQLAQPLQLGLQRELQRLATRAKIALSESRTTHIKLSFQDNQWQGNLTREIFETLIGSLVRKTIAACRRVIRDAKVTLSEVDNVVIVGGSTRVPLVRQQVEDYFGCEPLSSIDPDSVVAIGAALQADILSGNRKDGDLLLLDVIPLSLGIETMGGLVEKIIPRNTTIPVARSQDFTTFKDGQQAMSIHVLQGEREQVDHCRSLAKFSLTDIPPMLAGSVHVQVVFQVDADGLLSVTAMEKATGTHSSIQVKPSYGLSEEQMVDMLRSSVSHAQDDLQMRLLREQQIEAARILECMHAALVADGQLLNHNERTEIDEAVQRLSEVAQSDDLTKIKKAIKHIDKISADFAYRRMDDSILKALAGRNIDRV